MSFSSKSPSQRQGLSLLEVLVALALFAVAAMLITQTCVNILQSQWALASSQRSDEALEKWALREMLRIGDRDTFERGGRFDLPDERFVNWTAELRLTGLLDVLYVDLIIEYPLERGGRLVRKEVSRALFRPGWTPGSDRDTLLRDREAAWQDLQRERDLPFQ